MPHARTPVSMILLGAAVLGLAACSADATGQLGVGVDPAGRLLAIVVLCDDQHVGSLTLTDETTGTSTTVHPKNSPASGATVILTAPVGDPHPEGVFDLLDRAHDYTLTGTTTGADPDEQTGTFAPIRFRLDNVVTENRLRSGAVLTAGDGGIIAKDAFVSTARGDC